VYHGVNTSDMFLMLMFLMNAVGRPGSIGL
jgi:hypothetical protein